MTTRIAEPQPPRPTTRRGFEIAIVCALPLEADAVDALFDIHWDDDGGPPFDKAPGDPNAYSTGAIGRHNVVLAHMPGMGTANAAAVAANCRASFPNIKLALVVGVCGVVPFGPNGEEIVLGDVIVSDGVIQYDLGRRLPNRFVRKDTLLDSLGRPNAEIRGVLAKLKGLRNRKLLGSMMASYLDILRLEPLLGAEYPGTAKDSLFEATFRHMGDKQSCEQLGCNGKLVPRRRLETTQGNPEPTVQFGLIASGNSVMKCGEERDNIAAAEGVVAFEMEGAGVWDSFPCVVIKGACDYADSHKSKVWQRYAAATAAACMKAFLTYWVPSFPAGAAAEESGRIGRHSVHYIPFTKNKHFVGRTNTIEHLKGMLLTEAGDQQVALVGLGGIGKTQVALHLAHWVKDNKPEYSVLWMPAFSMAGFEQACTELVKKLGIRWNEKQDAKVLVQQHLSSEAAGSWLLIVDNADEMLVLEGSRHQPGGILNFLPQSDAGRILFTTRSQEVAVTAAGSAVIRLPEMSQEEATNFLEKSLIHKEQLQNEGFVAELLEKLTNLPLAIAQAAAYINMNQVSIAEYLRLFGNTDQDMIELLSSRFRDRTHYYSSQGAVATTWIISFNQIRKAATTAASLLSFMACVEPKAIPRSLLPRLETEQQMTQAIGTLLGYGFLNQREDEQIFDMHSLVHLATRIWAEDQEIPGRTQHNALAHLQTVFPSDEWENRELWRQYLPHALRILGTRRGADEEGCQLGFWVGRCLLADGRTQEAVRLLEYVAAIREKTLAEDHPSRLVSQQDLAAAYYINGQVKEAIGMLEYVVGIWETTVADDYPDRLASQNNLAEAYQANGQVKEAIGLLQHVVRIREKTVAEDHTHRLASEHTLARAYKANRQVKEAIGLLQHVVRIREKTVAEDNPSRLASQHELSGAYLANGQVKEAIELLEHVVTIRGKTLAEDHPDRLTSLQALAVAYRANGKVNEAIRQLEYVVQIWGKILAEDHPFRLASEHELAVTYQANRQVKEAIGLLQHVVAIRQKILAEDHPDRLASEYELAASYQANRQGKEAVELLEHVVAVREKTLAEDRPDRLVSQQALTAAYQTLSEAYQALTAEYQALIAQYAS
ncbi:Hypothetical protein NCS54_01512900 [Fusarium falciforme]|uniref:Hypothetical protein n=1 Tax=Fusarium falciforme TaxID=195108 RepID=UPI00230153EB|nr:Hypothetical protein NCS54_01512900 [Fusarium falciforme]WAO97400.1 Hypothetical protein NCS54_01512900 [Fusarium falciforme]